MHTKPTDEELKRSRYHEAGGAVYGFPLTISSRRDREDVVFSDMPMLRQALCQSFDYRSSDKDFSLSTLAFSQHYQPGE
jgi:hypothetical protein